MAGVRTSFSEDEDMLLVKFIATYNPAKAGRSGTLLYRRLVENVDGKWDWSDRHPWTSWRERYTRHMDEFDRKILKYQRKKGIIPEKKVVKNNPMLLLSDSEEDVVRVRSEETRKGKKRAGEHVSSGERKAKRAKLEGGDTRPLPSLQPDPPHERTETPVTSQLPPSSPPPPASSPQRAAVTKPPPGPKLVKRVLKPTDAPLAAVGLNTLISRIVATQGYTPSAVREVCKLVGNMKEAEELLRGMRDAAEGWVEAELERREAVRIRKSSMRGGNGRENSKAPEPVSDHDAEQVGQDEDESPSSHRQHQDPEQVTVQNVADVHRTRSVPHPWNADEDRVLLEGEGEMLKKLEKERGKVGVLQRIVQLLR